MIPDPIVTEIRAIRDEFAAQCGYDIKKMFQQLRERQADSGRKYVRYPARRVAPTEDERAREAEGRSR